MLYSSFVFFAQSDMSETRLQAPPARPQLNSTKRAQWLLGEGVAALLEPLKLQRS